MAERTRPLTEKQRHVLSTLARGGVIVHYAGVRGQLISTRLFGSMSEAQAELFGENVHPALFRSLKDSGAAFSEREDPELIESFKPRGVNLGMARLFRITVKGRAALKVTR
jgi:hypothetical protein